MKRLEGILWILLASVFFAAMGAMTKQAVPNCGTAAIILSRSLVVAVIAFGILRATKTSMQPGNLRLIFLRSLGGLMAMSCFFWSLGQLQLGAATTLLYTSPLFTVLLAGLVLGEKTHKGTIPLTMVAFAGIGLIIQPETKGSMLGLAAALGAGIFAAMARMAVRSLRHSDPPARIVFYFSLIAAGGSLPFALGLIPGLDTAPTPAAVSDNLHWLLGIGVSGAIGQLTMTQAYRVEQANIVSPFSYATVLLSYVLGLWFWDERLTWASGTGMALVVLSGALLSRSADAKTPPTKEQEPQQQEEPPTPALGS